MNPNVEDKEREEIAKNCILSERTSIMEVDLMDVLTVNDELITSLANRTKLCQDIDNRKKLTSHHFKDVSLVLQNLINESPIRHDVLAEVYRYLRNSAVACTKNQDIVREETTILKETSYLLKQVTEEKNETLGELVTVRCALQFLANSIVDNQATSILICTEFIEELEKLMQKFHKDEKVIQHSAMIFHLMMKLTPANVKLSSTALQLLLENLQLEFVIYAMESWVQFERFVDDYELLDIRGRIKLLNFLNSRADLLKEMNEKMISTFKNSFIERSDFILKSKVCDTDNLFCWEIAVLLELICSASSFELPSLKLDSVLLTTTLCLLRQIDLAGKGARDSDNVFAPIEDLAKLTSIMQEQENCETVDMRAHPTFQFKGNLIRLIGNLSHRNETNQDKVRELECLPIVLDCCKLDARNPFIAQWSVLAIRNLCEGNDANQSYIKKIQRIDTEKFLPAVQLVEVGKENVL